MPIKNITLLARERVSQKIGAEKQQRKDFGKDSKTYKIL
jgi:hypothetical protein